MNIAPMRALSLKLRSAINIDKLGIFLSFLCVVHCLVTPFVLMSLPIVARYYVVHPSFHWVLAIIIVPVGLFAFYQGYKHHQKKSVYYFGIPGLLIVGIFPVFFHKYINYAFEPYLITLGSLLIITAHWINRRSCSCELHR